MNTLSKTAVSFCLVGLLSGTSHAALIDYDADAANSIRQTFLTGNANTVFENEQELDVSQVVLGLTESRVLIRFDDLFGGLNPIDVGTTINSATLSLTTSTSSNNSISVYQVLTPWDESSVTWNNFNNGGSAGVDYEALALDSIAPSVADAAVDFDVTDAVLNWQGGATNAGFLLTFSNSTLLDSAGFYSENSTTASFRPNLQIDYDETPVSAVPLAGTVALLPLGLMLLGTAGWRVGNRASSRARSNTKTHA